MIKIHGRYTAGFLVGGTVGFICAKLTWPVWALLIFAVVVFCAWHRIIKGGGNIT